jgi:predicted restriction endonuclease
VRVGQAKFRERLLEKYDAACAISGPAPVDALEAAHLYSFAANPEHDYDGGGFLLRRDLHRLFDRGQLTIDPDTQLIEVSSELAGFSDYARLHDQRLRIELTTKHRTWLQQHRKSVWRGPSR